MRSAVLIGIGTNVPGFTPGTLEALARAYAGRRGLDVAKAIAVHRDELAQAVIDTIRKVQSDGRYVVQTVIFPNTRHVMASEVKKLLDEFGCEIETFSPELSDMKRPPMRADAA